MNNPTHTVERLIAALSTGALDTVMTLYAPNATFVAEPGSAVTGRDAIRQAMEAFLADLKPTLRIEESTHFVLGETAVVVARWTGTGDGPGGSRVELAGRSANVLARQPDGHWLMLLDNPWGTDLFG